MLISLSALFVPAPCREGGGVRFVRFPLAKAKSADGSWACTPGSTGAVVLAVSSTDTLGGAPCGMGTRGVTPEVVAVAVGAVPSTVELGGTFDFEP